MIDLLLLGNGAMVPLPKRPLSALQVRSNGRLVLFDCGEGTQVQMRKFHWGYRNLEAICLSHLHADHVAGLPGLFHTVANAGRTEPLHIYGPVGTIAVVQGLRVIAPWLPFDMVMHELDDGDSFDLLPGVRATVRLGMHRVPCLGWRVDVDRSPAFLPDVAQELGVPQTDWGRLQRGDTVMVGETLVKPEDVLGPARAGVSFAFITDTRVTAELEELISGVDLLVCEATYGQMDDSDKAGDWGHMTLQQACAFANAAGAKRLWLTHFGGTVDDPAALAPLARNLFPAAVIGEPGLTTTLSFSPDDALLPSTNAEDS
jgi:ribonuclease Z